MPQIGPAITGPRHLECTFSGQRWSFVTSCSSKQWSCQVIKEIIRQCPDAGELVDLKGQNILHVAVLSGKANVVRCILETIALEGLINQPDHNGNSPFHLTTMERRSWIAAYLLWDARVDQTARNKKGETAFDIDEPTKEPRVIPSVSMLNCRQLRLPHLWNLRGGFLPCTNEEKAGVLKSKQTYKQIVGPY
ncbi:ankyrin repeat-containing protein At5g02620-like [Syzygium oleosum]|uniref:ankyrin repeat-containing protein At5g02620-like n=1 Tax=Syzygium oleosum TaxID=219896 RepID=UPI0024B884B7|nr:ankyrin repeat-containing protein At5g02620-like [Syzygium oleosum]